MKLCPSTINNTNSTTPQRLAQAQLSSITPAPRAKAEALASEVKLNHSTHALKTSAQYDVDEARVRLIKSAIASGKYAIDASSIAQRMIDEMSDLG